MEMLSKQSDLWRGCVGTIKTTHTTIDKEEGTRSIRQKPYCAEQGSQEVLREKRDKQLTVAVIKPSQ